MRKLLRRPLVGAVAAITAVLGGVTTATVTATTAGADTIHISGAGPDVEIAEACRVTGEIGAAARYAQYRARVNELNAADVPEDRAAAIIADEFGIVRIDLPDVAGDIDAGTNTPSSTDVKLHPPTFSYDRCLRTYVMAASWSYNLCTISGMTQPCWTKYRRSPGNMGGPDGMALNINRSIFRGVAGISTSDNCGRPVFHNDQPAEDTDYGVGFIEQDVVSYDGGRSCAGTPLRYNWHRGTISTAFDFQGNCAEIRLKINSRFGHTWSSTSVTGIGIGAWSISFSWSTSDHRWEAYPATPRYSYC